MASPDGFGLIDTTGERIVLHVDIDCFYAACERLREPELEGKPVIVGMGFDPEEEGGGAVATASYEAREYGVESAQPINEAMERLPPAGHADEDGPVGYYRPVDMAFYKEQAAAVKEILAEYADVVREVSIDEAYLDCSERVSWSDVERFARAIKDRIVDEVGLPASVGVAPSMSVAKIASDHDKPDGLVIVKPGEVESFLAPLPIESLHGVGPVTAAQLAEMGIETIGDLAETDRGTLNERFGSRGTELYQRSRGNDSRPVTPRGDPKSLSRESAFREPTDDMAVIRERVTALAQDVARRAAERGAMYRTIGIKVVTPPFDVQTRERSLPGPVEDPSLVIEVATELLDEFEGARLRKVGVRVSNLSFEPGDQAQLGSWDFTESDPDHDSRSRSRRGQVRLGDFLD